MIFFYNSNNWPLRPEAKHYYDLLIEVGIFHSSAESAAQKVNEIWDDVQGWWGKGVVQEARRVFCDQFVRMPQHPIRELKKALQSN
jgi:putative transferase (TIGR04331 family)